MSVMIGGHQYPQNIVEKDTTGRLLVRIELAKTEIHEGDLIDEHLMDQLFGARDELRKKFKDDSVTIVFHNYADGQATFFAIEREVRETDKEMKERLEAAKKAAESKAKKSSSKSVQLTGMFPLVAFNSKTID
jgi:hypothetical protein